MINTDADLTPVGGICTEMREDTMLSIANISSVTVCGAGTRLERKTNKTRRTFSHACECDKVRIEKGDVDQNYVFVCTA